jgi:hypothetical protein
LVQSRIEDGYPPIVTWRAMKEELRARFVPHNYIRSLYDRLQNLKQGPLSVDDYLHEMELILQRARVREQPEQTMQHFLAGLNYNIKRIVRHHQYFDMTDLLHKKHVRQNCSWLMMPSLHLVLQRIEVVLHRGQHLVWSIHITLRLDSMGILRPNQI